MNALESAIMCVAAYETEDIGSADCHAIVDAGDGEIRVAFRGSEDGGDWLSNLRRLRVDFGAGTAHHGFLDSLSVITADIAKRIQELGDATTPIHVVGHSRGGAHAQLFAAQMRMQGHQLVRVTTFGSPRVFDRRAAEWFDGNIVHHRFVYENDIVPHLPIINYWHTGELHWWDGAKWRSSMPWLPWLKGLLRFGREHDIDTYITALR